MDWEATIKQFLVDPIATLWNREYPPRGIPPQISNDSAMKEQNSSRKGVEKLSRRLVEKVTRDKQAENNDSSEQNR